MFSIITLNFPGGSDGKASAYSAGDLGSIPGSGISPGEGNSNSKGNILNFSVFSCANKSALILIVPFSVVSYLILKWPPLSISFRFCNSTIDFVHSTYLET